MIQIFKTIFIFIFFSSIIFSEERDLKEIFSQHYFRLVSMSEEMVYYKYIFLIKSLKDKIFCDSIKDKDVKFLVPRSDLAKNKYFYDREKLIRKMEKGVEEYRYGIGFGQELITIPSSFVPEESLKNVFIIKKQLFINCEGENLEKFELSKKKCTEFEFEYYIFTDKDKIEREFCFRLFSFYDENGRGSVYFPRRKVKFFGTLSD